MNFIKQAFRNIRSKPSHFLINLSGLSVAFAVFMLIMLYVINESNFDKFNTKGDRIYRIEEGSENQVPMAVSRISQKTFPEIEKSAVLKLFNNSWISYNHEFYEIDELSFTDNSFFEIFTIPFVEGDPQTALSKPNTIVLSETWAKKIFGNKSPIGEQLNFRGQDLYTVTGVIRDLPDFHLPAKALASFKSVENKYGLNDDTWSWGLVSYVLLNENSDSKLLEGKMNEFFGQMEHINASAVDFKLRPFHSIYLATDTSGNDETKHGSLYLLVVLAIVGVLIIVVASINFINLSLSQGMKKMKEISVKRILGGSGVTIFFQYVVDSMILCISAVLVSLAFVFMVFHSYENLIGRSLNVEQVLSPKYLLFVLGSILLMGAIYGFLQVYFLTTTETRYFQNGSKKLLKSKGLNKGLITFQYVVSIVLIIGTAFIYRQLNFIRNQDLGFDDHQLLSLDLSSDIKNNLNSFKARLLEDSNIKGLSFVSDNITQFNQYSRELEIDDKRISMNYAAVDPDFIPLLDIEMVQGENFSWDIKSQANSGYILNEAAWDLLKNTSLKEKGFELENRSLLGVAGNFHFESFHTKINPVILYWNSNELSTNRVLLKLSGNSVVQTLGHIDEVFHEFAPGSLCKYRFVNQELDYLYQAENTLVKLFSLFSLLAVFIAGLGIFSLSRITAENRIKEIGIRKVNGANISEILTMLNKDFVKWVIIAFVIATPIAWFAMHKWLENFAYKTTLSWWIFALAGLLALGIALLTVSWQSWRAATRNPVEALRYE
ncbi:FtsX-like permease family protein [uncultured Draconibacterium sp.]|uniref:ABC transporter permease n=1 Tax=uncultured Draconibacterium sp. TaxID=1573823 RepID=UPI002AA8F10B|nr:FtsX-like permease family protein [uncultured Draconibacterium sp.]